MARLSDHDVRDAQAAMRAEIALLAGLYTRRMAELAKAYIQEALEEASKIEGGIINGTAIGRAAAERAAFDYYGGLAGTQHPTIESAPHREEA